MLGAIFDKALEISADQFTAYAAKILEERGEEFRFCQVVNAGGGEFEVRNENVNMTRSFGYQKLHPVRHLGKIFPFCKATII